MSDHIGQVFGNYRIEKLLGSGGMGQVYKASHVLLPREAAIKLMHDHLAQDPTFQARFLQEARAVAALKHPNIVEVYDFGNLDGRFYLVLELMPQGSLRTLLAIRAKTQKAWPLALSLHLVLQAAAALAYAHQQKIVHRDVKPDNMLLRTPANSNDPMQLELKLTDFGLVRLAEGSSLTSSGMTLGTPPYMSPEQCQGSDIDGRSDIYSLGVVLYEVFTGMLPFQVRTISDAVYKHVNTPPPSPRQFVADLAPAIEQVILRCLAKAPADRYQRAEDLIVDLQAIAAGASADALPSTVIAAPPATPVLTPPITPSSQLGTAIVPPSIAPTVLPPSPQPLSTPSPLPRLEVLDSQQQSLRVLELKGDGLTIGRLSSNGLPLDTEAVSRHHARVDWDGQNVTLTDIGSSNGTFLAGRQLPANTPTRWPWNELARVGAFWLRIVPPSPATPDSLLGGLLGSLPPTAPAAALSVGPSGIAAQAAPTVMESRVSPSLVGRLANSGRIGVILDRDQQELQLDQPNSVPITLANFGSQVDHLTLMVSGVPEAWVRTPAQAIQLNPGMQTTAALTITPPREPTSRAGAYKVVIVARSRNNPDESGKAEAAWTVPPFSATSLELKPRIASGRTRASYSLVLKNQGNAPATYALSGEDDAQALTYSFTEPQPSLEPGASVNLPLVVGGRQHWIGAPLTRGFRVSATSAGKAGAADGQFSQPALLPAWVTILIVPLLLLCAGLGYMANQQFVVAPPATATAQAAAAIATSSAVKLSTAQAETMVVLQAMPAQTQTALLASITAAAQQTAAAAPTATIPSPPTEVPTPTAVPPTEVPPPTAVPPTAVPSSTAAPLSEISPTPTPTHPIIITPPIIIPPITIVLPKNFPATATAAAALTATAFVAISPEDCLPYDPNALLIKDQGSSGWQLTDGRSSMLILDNQADAQAALNQAKRHTAHCFIGRGNTRTNRRSYIVQYWPGNSGINTSIASEDCIGYNQSQLAIVNEGANGWLLTDGASRMLMLDNETDARNALALARRYTQQCFIGRSNARTNRIDYIVDYWK
jgi:eukaryotic-like serine/threonine-protein kinase